MPRVNKPATTAVIDQPDTIAPEPVAQDQTGEPIASPPTTSYSDAAQNAMDDAEKLEFVLTELATTLAREGRPANGRERILFAKASPNGAKNGYTLDRFIRSRIQTAQHVLEYQHAAGSPSARIAAAERLKDAQQAEAEKTPEIEAQIRELRNQLAELAAATNKAERTVTKQADAVEFLQEERWLPAPIREALRSMHASTRNERLRLGELTSRARTIRTILSFDPTDQTTIYRYADSSTMVSPVDGSPLLDHLFAPRNGSVAMPGNTNPSRQPQDVGRWRAYCRVLEAELTEVLEELERAEHVSKVTAAEARRLREYWLPRDPEPTTA